MSMSRAFAIAAASTIISALAQAQDKGPAPTACPSRCSSTRSRCGASRHARCEGRGPAASPCTEDIEALCKGVKPGEGDVLRCLADKSGELSSACKDAWSN